VLAGRRGETAAGLAYLGASVRIEQLEMTSA